VQSIAVALHELAINAASRDALVSTWLDPSSHYGAGRLTHPGTARSGSAATPAGNRDPGCSIFARALLLA
jgi:hypothetical protein